MMLWTEKQAQNMSKTILAGGLPHVDHNQGEEFDWSFCNDARADVKLNLESESSMVFPAGPLPKNSVHYH